MFSDNKKQNRTARIKLKSCDKLNIYDIYMIKILTTMATKIYLYIDDRTIDENTIQKMISNTYDLLHKFDVKLPDVVIRYTDYYTIAWIYLHRLVMMGKTILNYNSSQCADDLQVFLSTNKIKIFLIPDPVDTDNNIQHNGILYDNGWFRDIFIEMIIDDAENVDYMIDEIKKMPTQNNFIKINKTFIQHVCNILKFKQPTCVLTQTQENIEILRTYEQKNSNTTKYILTLNDLTLDQIGKIGICMDHVHDMIHNHDISLQKYITQINTTSQTVDTYKSPDIIANWLIDPIKIDLDEIRTFNIAGIQTQIGAIYMESTDLALFEKDSALINNNNISFKIRFIGSILINKINEQYVCKWSNDNKKKKKMQKQLLKWIPYNDNFEHQLTVYKFTYPTSPTIHKLLIRRVNLPHDKQINIIGINANYYLIQNDKLLEFII